MLFYKSMHLRNYEKPEGWSKGDPEVLVTQFAARKLGMPAVNYDSLHQLLTDDLGTPYDERTTIKLYGAVKRSPVLGFHAPYTKTVHVNAVAAEERFRHQGGTMRVVGHEGRHRADSSNAKVRTAIEIAARWISYKAGFEVAHHLPLLESAPGVAAFMSRMAYYEVEPPEIRARRAEKSRAVREHEQDILFPKSDRTAFLRFTGNLSDAAELALDRADKVFV
jgi:hypothetical protein